MTQEEKQLLLKDLCTRLPYGVICQFIWTYSNETTDGEDVIAKEDDNIKCIDIYTKEIQAHYYGEWVDLEHCKPYLRPMSSMTEEEIKTYHSYCECNDGDFTGEILYFDTIESFGYLTSIHIDYRGLIPMGLALEATEGMYKTE